MSKRAVVLLNLGSPKSTSVGDVRIYLREFLGDERVIDYPAIFRFALLEGIVLRTRPRKSAAAYRTVWTPEGAPLLVTTEKLRAKLEVACGLPVITGMRYGEPSCAQAVERLLEMGVEEAFILPQYPHYAMSSYETVVVKIQEELLRRAPGIRWQILQPYFDDPAYIAALVASAQPWLSKPFDKVLFSYHGVPERHLRKGDASKAHCTKVPNCCEVANPSHANCYRHQCTRTTELFRQAAGLRKDQVELAFQSRFGPEQWLRPYTDKRLEAMPGEGIKNLLVMCPAFTADCLETIEEIGMEGAHEFKEAGGQELRLIPSLNSEDVWADAVTTIALENAPTAWTRSVAR
jgi:ferrochelatase